MKGLPYLEKLFFGGGGGGGEKTVPDTFAARSVKLQ